MLTKSKFAQSFLSVIVILTMTLSGVQPLSVSAQESKDGIRRDVNVETGKVSFIGPESGRILSASEALGSTSSAHSADPAMALAKRFAPEFGVQNPERELTQMRSKETDDGRVTVRYQQNYQGIPVMGGELIVNTNKNGDLYSMNGEASQNLSVQTNPTIDSAQASDTALQAMAKWYQATSDNFIVSEPELWIFDESLLKPSDRPVELVWRMEVTSKDESMPVRELVLVNAERGSISLHFNQIDNAWTPETSANTKVSETVAPSITKSTKDRVPNLLGNTWYVATTGNDLNNCATTSTPCATINGAIDKAASGDTILVATGTYTGSGSQVVVIDKDIILMGGWDTGFTTQSGVSTIDGEDTRGGVTEGCFVASLNRFIITNGAGYGVANCGDLTITDSTIQNSSGSSYGGGISISSGNVVLNNVTVSGNTAYYGGGIAIISGGTLSLNNVTINNNNASYGGGIYSYGGIVTINNSTISGNDAETQGGGIYFSYSNTSLDINNSSIVNNSSPEGGGFYRYMNSGVVNFRNTVLADNTATTSTDCTGIINHSLGYNLIGNNSGCTFTPSTGDLVGTSTNPIKPRLTPLQDNGGPTFTHALMVGSPAIDAGNPAVPGSGGNACLAVDQRGVARPNGTRCDIGAYEGSVPWTTAAPLVKTYTANHGSNLPGTLLCNQTKPTCPAGDSHAKKAHQYAIGVYNLYATKHIRDSIDNNGMTIKSTVHYKNNYDNAFWNGTQMVYGDAYGFPLADDIVGHELTHGVTQYESGLFYFYQSGAIDESLADVWGEYYDQTNHLGNDASNVKWLLGEDVTGLGAIRSMKNPPQFGDPDKMSSPNYIEDITDNGGVHANSGVNNKAVYLMVDGGTFNGKTITKLGWDKTAAIYYEANTDLLTSGSDYSDLFFALQQACSNLIGLKGITSSNCVQVKNALLVVEMDKQPAANFNPDAAFCPANLSTGDPLSLFKDDFESGETKWTKTGSPQKIWSLENGYASNPIHMFYGDDTRKSNDLSLAMKTGVSLPAGSKAFLHFDHAFLLDYGVSQGTTYYFDGGVLEYSINNGSTWKDAQPLFSAGQNYKGTIYSGFGNKLKGRPAFVGDSHGYVSSLYNLSSLAGKKVQFRWRLATDSSVSFFGWFVDDVQIYTCVGTPSKPTLLSPANNALVTDYTPHLDWSNSTPAPVKYQLQIANNNAFTSPLYNKSNLATSGFTVPTDLAPNTTFYWRVRAFNALNQPSAWSTAFSFRTVLAPPVLLTPTDGETIASLQPELDWKDVAGATGYVVQVSSASDFSTTLVDVTPTDSTYQVPSDLPSVATIYWRVQATGPNGPSDWSTFSFVTP